DVASPICLGELTWDHGIGPGRQALAACHRNQREANWIIDARSQRRARLHGKSVHRSAIFGGDRLDGADSLGEHESSSCRQRSVLCIEGIDGLIDPGDRCLRRSKGGWYQNPTSFPSNALRARWKRRLTFSLTIISTNITSGADR